MNNKRAIGPVVAISLLVIVVVVTIIGFGNWYNNYSSKTFTNVENNEKSKDISIESISNNIIFIKNDFKDNYTLKKIIINDNECILNQNLSLGINNISINYCLSETGINDISLVTEDRIIQKNIFIEDFSLTKYDKYTKFIMHCDDSITDDSDSNHPITLVGNPQISSNQSRWKNSCYFDGDGDYLTMPFHSDFALGSQNFTIDFWVYFDTNPPETFDFFIMDDGVGNNDFNAYFYKPSNSANFYINEDTYIGDINGNIFFSNNIWYHVAYVRFGDEWRIYVDGTQTNNGTFAGAIDTSNLNIMSIGYSGRPPRGYIDEYRISVGIARWTSNFFLNSKPYK